MDQSIPSQPAKVDRRTELEQSIAILQGGVDAYKTIAYALRRGYFPGKISNDVANMQSFLQSSIRQTQRSITAFEHELAALPVVAKVENTFEITPVAKTEAVSEETPSNS